MQPVLNEISRVNKHLPQRSQGARLEAGLDQAVLSRRTVSRDLMITQDSLDAEQVKAIADCNDPCQLLLFEKLDALLKTVNRVEPLVSVRMQSPGMFCFSR